eukprot:2638510-Rhodomonas_salina.2
MACICLHCCHHIPHASGGGHSLRTRAVLERSCRHDIQRRKAHSDQGPFGLHPGGCIQGIQDMVANCSAVHSRHSQHTESNSELQLNLVAYAYSTPLIMEWSFWEHSVQFMHVPGVCGAQLFAYWSLLQTDSQRTHSSSFAVPFLRRTKNPSAHVTHWNTSDGGVVGAANHPALQRHMESSSTIVLSASHKSLRNAIPASATRSVQ